MESDLTVDQVSMTTLGSIPRSPTIIIDGKYADIKCCGKTHYTVEYCLECKKPFSKELMDFRRELNLLFLHI